MWLKTVAVAAIAAAFVSGPALAQMSPIPNPPASPAKAPAHSTHKAHKAAHRRHAAKAWPKTTAQAKTGAATPAAATATAARK
jgi:hypothetical protein